MESTGHCTYGHGGDKVGRAFLEPETSRNNEGAGIRDQSLDNEDGRDDSQISELLCCELGPKLCED